MCSAVWRNTDQSREDKMRDRWTNYGLLPLIPNAVTGQFIPVHILIHYATSYVNELYHCSGSWVLASHCGASGSVPGDFTWARSGIALGFRPLSFPSANHHSTITQY